MLQDHSCHQLCTCSFGDGVLLKSVQGELDFIGAAIASDQQRCMPKPKGYSSTCPKPTIDSCNEMA